MTRYMGTETEYGISTPSQPEASPIVTSTHAVVSYAAMRTGARSRWDYEDERPLSDARGFDLRRYRTVPIVDSDAVGIANVMTTNGARYYVDHAHPEYSSPEVSNAWDAMIYDAAGDLVLRQSIADIQELADQGISLLKNHDPCPPLKIYKNNVDGKGASYGSHENYQYSRHTDFDAVVAGLIPFFVARQVIIGAGRLGIGEAGEEDGFQISQRADYFFQEISLETTLNRGIVNTRDEPHADAGEFRRLHTIVGDANMSQYANFLKLGMTKLVLDAIEAGVDFSDLRLKDPVAELKHISHDLTLTHETTLIDARSLTALDILAEYRARVSPEDEVDEKVLELWDEIAADLARDPLSTADRLDWTAKYALIKGYLDRGVPIGDAKLKLIDLQYTDIDPAKSLYHALVRKGRMKTLVSDDVIAAAVENPPKDSRAYFRGRITQKFPEHIKSASWQIIELEFDGVTVRYSTPQVDALTAAEVGEAVDSSENPADLVARLRSAGIHPS